MARMQAIEIDMLNLPAVQELFAAGNGVLAAVRAALEDPAIRGTRAELLLRSGLREYEVSVAEIRRRSRETRG